MVWRSWADRGKINNVASFILANRKCGGESADVSRLDQGRPSRQREKHRKRKLLHTKVTGGKAELLNSST